MQDDNEYHEYCEPSIHPDLLAKLYKSYDSDNDSVKSENSYAALANNLNDDVIDISDDNSREDEISAPNSPDYSAPLQRSSKAATVR